MISFIRGSLASIKTDSVIIDVHGIGYHVAVPLSIISKLPSMGEEVFLHTCLILREEKLQLFGFLHEEELDMFLQLINISGIGSKVALSLLSALNPSELAAVVGKEDVNVLIKVPGIGKKTAKRIILELKDKLKLNKFSSVQSLSGPYCNTEPTYFEDAVAALLSLGYKHSEAVRVIQEIERENGKSCQSVEELIRLALKKLARG